MLRCEVARRDQRGRNGHHHHAITHDPDTVQEIQGYLNRAQIARNNIPEARDVMAAASLSKSPNHSLTTPRSTPHKRRFKR